MNYQKLSQEILDRFETTLREFISAKLMTKYGKEWWKIRIPGGVLQNCQERLDKDLKRTFPKVPIGQPIDYSHVGELKEIIVRKDNYREVFSSFFGTNPDGIRTKLEEIGVLRDTVRHVRPGVGEKEYNRLDLFCGDIFDAIGASAKAETPAVIQNNSEEPEDIEISDAIASVKCFDNLPRPDYSKFHGREMEREAILEHLAHPRAWVVSIDGIGGVGKTALALNCAYTVKEQSLHGGNQFEYIVWASAKTQRLTSRGVISLAQTFSDLNTFLSVLLEVTGFAEKANAPLAEKIQLAQEILCATSCLLILDNLETIKDLELFAFLSNLPSPSKALVTSRVRIEESQRNLRLIVLPMQEARALLTELAGHLDASEIAVAQSYQLERLIERVGGIPLAIKLAVGKIASGTSLQSYIGRLESGAAQEDILEFCFSDTWIGFTDDEKRTVSSVALFDEPPSEEELRRVASLPELRVQEALARLLRHAFLNAAHDLASETVRYSLLPLTADFVLRRLKEDSALERDISDSYRAYLVDKGRYEEALGQLGQLIRSEGPVLERERLSNMLVEAGFRAYQGGNYISAVGRLESAKTYHETSYLYHTWGVIERDEGHYGTARDKFKRAIDLDERSLPTWRSWGKMEQRLESYNQAMECFHRAAELPGSDLQDRHSLGVCLTRIVRTAKTPDERASLLTRAVDCFGGAFYNSPVGYRETHHNVVNSHALALALTRLGRRIDALGQCEKGLRLEPSNERLLKLKASLSSNR